MVAQIHSTNGVDADSKRFLIAVKLPTGESEVFEFESKHDRSMFLHELKNKFGSEFEWAFSETPFSDS